MTSPTARSDYLDVADNYSSLTPYNSQAIQRSQSITPSVVDDTLFSTERSWHDIWQEVTGLPEHGYHGHDGNNCNKHTEEIDYITSVVGDDIDTWAASVLGNFEAENVVHTLSNIRTDIASDIQPENVSHICYGTIYRVKMKLIGDMNRVTSKLQSANLRQIPSHFLLNLTNRNGKLLVTMPDDALTIGQLSEQLGDALSQLVTNNAVSLEVLVHRKDIFEDIGTAAKGSIAYTIVSINVYGPQESSKFIGRQLSSHKVWLQRPDWCTPGTIYENPHLLRTVTMTSMETVNTTSFEREIESSETAGFQESVTQVFSMLTRSSNLKRVSAGQRLKTTLYPHQEEALDFMLQRENGPLQEEYKLWERTMEKGQTWYRHTIAGVKSRVLPSETGGGILADEMGIGKTFSILSLVEKTLEAAEGWATDPANRLIDDISHSKDLSRATLVVVPSPLLITTWVDEIRKHIDMTITIAGTDDPAPSADTAVKDTLKVLLYHGKSRAKDTKAVLDFDLVITTYHTLIADHNRQRDLISHTAWYRVVLDEAHFIRRPSTYLHKRVAELEAKFRWCLTGTPIQNRLDDLGSLFMFLRIPPFDRLSVFRQCIVAPFTDKTSNSRRQIGQRNLARLLDSLCLRRTKTLLNLNNIFEATCQVLLSAAEREQYERMRRDMKRTMQHDVDSIDRRSRFGLFQVQLQSRLLCNHGTFQHPFHWARARTLTDEREDMLALSGGQGETQCSGCQQSLSFMDFESSYDLQETCGHVLCAQCKYGFDNTCPLCEMGQGDSVFRHNRESQSGTSSQMNYFRSSGYSSKLERLIQDLKACSPGDKSIVFSQWTSTLDLIVQHLKRENITFERVDGKTDMRRRQDILRAFEQGTHFSVLIMTTGVGAFGLNLIAANRVFIIEPQWNPSTELQAIGRTMRIGQLRPVHVTRYIVEGTVEKDMQQLQQGKLRMAGMARMAGSTDASAVVKSER